MGELDGSESVSFVSPTKRSSRRHDIDWLRVILFGLLIWFHYAVFSLGQLRGDQSMELFNLPLFFVISTMHQWRLAALFIISGMGTAFAFKSRDWRSYLTERIFRLGVPLMFFIYILSAGITDPIETTRLLFTPFPGIDEMPYGHLWFVFNLLIYSVALTPLFNHVRKNPEMGVVRFTRWLFQVRFGMGILLIPPLILSLNGILFKPWAFGEVGMNWEFSRYFLYFMFGFLMISAKEEYFAVLDSVRLPITIITPILSIVWFFSQEKFGVPSVMEGGWVVQGFDAFSTGASLASILQSFHAWFWCLLIFSWASKLLNRPSRWLPYLNESVYPAYIIHMTPTILMIIFLSVLGVNYYLGLILGTVVVTVSVLVIFEFVRRASLFRFLFGIKGGSEEVSKVWPFDLTRDRGTRVALSVFFNSLVVCFIVVIFGLSAIS